MTTYVSNRNSGETDEQGHYRFQTKAWSGNVLDGLLVEQNSPLARNVVVPEGDLKIDYSDYAYTAWNDADEVVAIATADTSNPRIDRIIAYINRSGSLGSTNNPGILVFVAVAGTPAGSPTKASDGAVTSAVGATNPWCEIATVRVEANATTIPNSKITDTRTLATLDLAKLAATVQASLSPSGIIAPFAGSASPTGWLLCDGSSLLRASYPALFATIGTAYGSADGTHFNVPDLRGRTPVGADAMGGTAANRTQRTTTLTTTNGSPTATVGSATNLSIGMAVTNANVPAGTTISAISGTTLTLSANATGNGTAVAATFSLLANDATVLGSNGGSDVVGLVTAQMPVHNHNTTSNNIWMQSSGYGNVNIGSTGGANGTQITPAGYDIGGNQAHSNMQPSVVTNFIIKT